MNPNHYFLPNPNGRSPRSFRPNPSISANFRRQSKVFKLYQAPSTLINHPPFLSEVGEAILDVPPGTSGDANPPHGLAEVVLPYVPKVSLSMSPYSADCISSMRSLV